MSISREFSTAKGAIASINADNLDTQKPRASGAVDELGWIGRQIAGLARDSQGDNEQVKTESTEAQSEMNRDMQEAQSKFTNAMNEATRGLEAAIAEAQENFSQARTAAEEGLAVDIGAAQTRLSGHVSTIQSRASKIGSSLNRIEDLAS